MTLPIDSVKRLADGRYEVTFERSGYWIGIYRPDGRLESTAWQPAEHVPYIDPSELSRLAGD